MRWGLRILLGLAGLVLLAVIGGYVWLQGVDAEDYRTEIIQAVETETGRALTVGGALRIGGGLTPALVAEDVALADASWGGAEPMAKAGRVEIVIRLLPLLIGEVAIERIDVHDAAIALRRSAAGEANWQFGDDGETGARDDEGEAAGAMPAISSLRVRNATVTYANAATGAALEIGVTDLDIHGSALFGTLDIAFDGTYGDLPLSVTGEVGPADAVFAGGALEVDLEAISGDARLRATGRIGEPASFTGIDLALDGESVDLAYVNRFWPLDLPQTRRFAGTARLLEADGVYRFEDIDAEARIDNLDIAGTGDVADIDTFRDFSLQARLKGGNIGALGEIIDTPLPQTQTVEATGRFYRAGGRYGIEGLSGSAARPGAALDATGDVGDLEAFAGFDLDFSLSGEDLATLGAEIDRKLPPTRGYDIAGHIFDGEDGRRIEGLVALLQLPDAELSFDGRIGNLDALSGIDLVATAGGEDLAAALAAFGIDGGSAIPFSLDLRISDTGTGWVAEELSFSAGDSRATGFLTMEEGARPSISGNLESPHLDLDALLGRSHDLADISPFAETPDGRVFPEDPLPFAALQRADLDIGLQVAELLFGEGVYREVEGALRLNDGQLAVQDLRARFDEGRVVINAGADATTRRVTFDLQGDNIDVPAVLSALGIRSSLRGNRGAVSMDLAGQGGSQAALAASLEGRSDIVLGPGRLRDWTASVLTSDFIRLLSGDSGDGVDVECVVARFDIAEGVAQTDTVLIQTEGARLAPVGRIDLTRERYDMVLYSRSRIPSLATLAVPLRITGPLDDPSFTPDPAVGTIDTIGNLLSLATLGLSRDMFGDKVPAGCAAAGVEGARDQKGVIGGTTDALGGAVKDTVRGVGKAIDRIFGD